MVAGLSFRAIVELINSNNESGLKSFLDTQHANIDDKNEVKVAKYSELKEIYPIFIETSYNISYDHLGWNHPSYVCCVLRKK